MASQSAETLIRDIEDMKVKGAYLIACVALEALTLRAKEAAAANNSIAEALRADAARLQAAQPSMACVANGCAYVLHPLGQPETAALSTTEQIALVERRSQKFLTDFEQAQHAVLEIGARLIQDGDLIAVHSYSGTLLGIFRQARAAGKQFKILATESRPYHEGRYLVSELLKLEIPCSIMIDIAMASYAGRASMAMVGIDSILANGSVVNKIGTRLLAMVCQAHSLPFYAAGNLFKFSVSARQGGAVKMLERADDGGIAPENVANSELLQVHNLIFDITPAHLVTALITDKGVVPPAVVTTLTNDLLVV